MTIMYFKCKVNFLEIFMTCKYFFADKSLLGCWKSNKPLLKRSKSTKKKGKSTQTVFTGSFATNTSCIIFYEDALVEVVNVNEKKTPQTRVFGTILGLSSNIYYKF